MEIDDRQGLRDEIGRLLAAAMEADAVHGAEIARRDKLHVAEMDRRDGLHIAETERRDVAHHHDMERRQDVYDRELEQIRTALDTRDLIGQAKGIIIASMGCSADEAFVMLVKQSQAENRKVHEVAADISATAQKRR
jgi:hypothetical protein